jgi:hypothetical protein
VTEVGQCQSQITQLREITAAPTTTFTSEKDRAGLLDKLDGAVKALSAGKSSDAVQKLTNFRDKVTTLQLQGKIGPESTQLISSADAAIVCINSL